MFGSEILEVAIGILFIYLFLSLICSSINELIASTINKRGKYLFLSIKNILNDPKFTGLAQQLYSHGFVQGISQDASDPKKPNRLPSYMAANTFSIALIDLLSSKGVEDNCRNIVDKKTSELESIKAKLVLTPNDTELEAALKEAELELDKANKNLEKALAVGEANRAADLAAKEVTNIKNIGGLQKAAGFLEQALNLGRRIAAEFPDPIENIRGAVSNLPDGHTKQSLLVLIDKTRRELSSQPGTVRNDLQMLQDNIEKWFNDTMDRVSGWYKRWCQRIILAVSAILIITLNADSIVLIKILARDNALRASVVSVAEQHVTTNKDSLDSAGKQALLDAAEELKIPLGWKFEKDDPYLKEQIPVTFGSWLLKALGLIISVLAVSLGAPFWFDMLSKFINIRGAGTPPGEQKKGSS